MEYLIYGALKKYKRLHAARFHMPGHKADRKRFPLFKDAALDITELSFADCLENPDGLIAAAESDCAEILGAKRSFFLTDGSSSGIFAMLYAVKRRGGKIVIARGAHKSVYNACAVLGIEPHILKGNELDAIALPPAAAEIEDIFKKEKDVAAVLATSPDYYGNISDYAALRKICDRYGKLLLVDGAHGAYLKFDPDAAHRYAGEYADAWVDGAHKTLPTLTQGALLNVNREDLIPDLREGAGIFRTTSPSYPIMASIEYGVKYLSENGGQLIDAVKREFSLMKMRLKKRGVLFYEGSETLQFSVDFGGMGICPYLAEEQLEKRRIYPEMNDGRYILFYLSPLTRTHHLARLERAIRRIAKMRSLKDTYDAKPEQVCGIKKFSYLAALAFRKESVPIAQAAGRIAARNAGATPPCFPVVVAGEQITEQAVELLKNAKHTFGVIDGKIEVIKIGGEQ